MKQRIISAVIAFLIVIPLLILGGMYFKIGVTLISVLAIYEILKLKGNIPNFIKILSYILIVFMVFIDYSRIIKIFITLFILYIPIIFYDKEKYNVEDCTYLSSFIIFLGLVFSYMIVIRENDINTLIFLLLIPILTDTFAYFGGTFFGKHKLIPKVSPNKTIEGSIIGSIISTLVSTIFYIYMIDPGANILLTIFITLLLSIVGQLGDLVFSSIKRNYQIKDFSNLIPGHGGILDRLDSTIFVIICYIILVNIL